MTNLDGGAGRTTSATFRADGFNGDSEQPVGLTTCSQGFGAGTCTTAMRTIRVTQAPPPSIACALTSCTVPAGAAMDLHGDSSLAGFRYQTWRWTDAGGVTVTTQRDTGGTFVSGGTFSAAGFDGEVTSHATAELLACTQGFGAGSCADASVPIAINPAAKGSIACDGGPCIVQAGLTLGLLGSSEASGLRFHTWRWADATGAAVVTNKDTGATLSSSLTFDADGFNSASSRDVSLRACGAGFGDGTCTTTVATVRITEAPPPAIACATQDCSVEAGSALELAGDSSASQFPFHTWRWTNGRGEPVEHRIDTGLSFLSKVIFSANSFDAEQTTLVAVELTVCRKAYLAGSCSTKKSAVSVTPPGGQGFVKS